MRILIFAGFLLSFALAVTYQVDETGGPETLTTAVTEAFSAWRTLDETVEAVESEDASTVIRYGDAALFGPDTLSLTVQRSGTERSLSVLVTPAAEPEQQAVLLHETGLLLGLSATESGVMSPALGNAEIALGELESSALGSLQSALKEDVNRDGVVDFYDLADLARSFGQPGLNLPGDINEDGLIDRADLDLLRAAYKFTAPSSTAPNEQPEDDDALVEEFFGDEEDDETEDLDEESGEAAEGADPTAAGAPNDGNNEAVSEDDSEPGEPTSAEDSGDDAPPPTNEDSEPLEPPSDEGED